MYNIAFYENGQFCTNIGGPIPTLIEAIKQIEELAKRLDTKGVSGYYGYQYNRINTPCAILVTDRWGLPIKEEE